MAEMRRMMQQLAVAQQSNQPPQSPLVSPSITPVTPLAPFVQRVSARPRASGAGAAQGASQNY